MSHRIHLTSDPSEVDAPRGTAALWVYGNSARRPAAERAMRIGDVLEDTTKSLLDVKTLVIVGLVSNITRPSNRVKTGQILTDPLPGVERISIDDKLFIVDPWRLWWHFGCVGIWFGGFHVSYTLEGRWNMYVQRLGPNPCSTVEIEKWGDGVVRSTSAFRFDIVDIEIIETTDRDKAAYETEKEAAFNEEKTPKKIIERLERFASNVFPGRSVPPMGRMFESRMISVRATDLGVDRFLIQGIRERIELTNFTASRFAP